MINTPTENIIQPVIFLPDGRPAPVVMTDNEVIKLLRLEGKNPARTLKFYRDQGLLVGLRLGKKCRYRLIDVLNFLERKAKGSNE